MPATAQTAIAVIGIDIGKNSFHVVGQDTRGQIILRQKWSRHQVEARFANMPPCLIGMEACVGAHHLSRRLKALGHDARLMPAKYVRPYSKGQKNDFRDAEAIAEAVQRPTMKFVATKTADQLDLQALHRVRERLVSQRTGIINQIRAFLLERGITVRQGQRFLRAELPRILATPPAPTRRFRLLSSSRPSGRMFWRPWSSRQGFPRKSFSHDCLENCQQPSTNTRRTVVYPHATLRFIEHTEIVR
jgi:transposase